MADETHVPPELKCPNCMSDLPPLATDCDTCGRELLFSVAIEAIPEKREAYHAARLVAEYLPDNGIAVGDMVTQVNAGRLSVTAHNYYVAQNLVTALQEHGALASVRVTTQEAGRASASMAAPFPPVEWVKQHPFLVVGVVVILIIIGVLRNADVHDQINTAIQNERPTRTAEDIEFEQQRARDLLRNLEEQGQRHLERQEGR